MKEVFRPTGAELTRTPLSSTLGERGNISMDAGRPTEGPPGQGPKANPEVFLRQSLGFREGEQVVYDEGFGRRLERFVDSHERQRAQDLSKNPFDRLDNNRLVNEYFGLSSARENLEQAGLLAQNPSLAKKVNNYNTYLLQELERRGADLKELLSQKATEEGRREDGSTETELEEDERHGERFLKMFREVVEDPNIREVLISDEPDFSSNNGKLGKLKELIEQKINPATSDYLIFANYIASLKTEGDDKVISLASKKIIFEWLTEKIISIPDNTPEAHYRIDSFQIQNALATLVILTKNTFNKTDPEFARYIQELIHIREMAHELNVSFKHGETYKKYILEGLSASGLNFIQNEIAGVAQVVRLYEKIAAQKVREKKTWFSAKEISEIDEEVREVAVSMRKTNSLKTKVFVGKNEKDEEVVSPRNLTDWEMERALRLGKILFAGSQRYAMYAVQGNLPPDALTAERISSIPYEFIARALIPLKMIGARFFSEGGQRRFMQEVVKELKETGTYIELFGLDAKTAMFNSSGSFDPESHSWRSQLLFLTNIKVVTLEGEKTLLQYLTSTLSKVKAKPEVQDALFEAGKLSDAEKKEYEKEIENHILGQRLYLSALVNYGDLSDDLKTKLWQKIALLKPSTLIALLPKETLLEGEKAIWKGLSRKLYIAEELRLVEDAEKQNHVLSKEELETEATNFKKTLAIEKSEKKEESKVDQVDNYTAKDFELFRYFTAEKGNELSSEEKDLLEKIIKRGLKDENARKLAIAKKPFTYCIDDAPTIAWAKIEKGSSGSSQEDLLRLMFSDQDNVGKAWQAINSLIESPQEKFVEHIAEAVNNYGAVHGRSTAQDKFEPFIRAYFNLASTDTSTLWIPGKKTTLRVLNRPTSEMERYYRTSYISWDEDEKRDMLQALVQVKAIADDPSNVDKHGMTKLDKLRKDTKSDRVSLLIRMARIIFFMFGPVVAYEFLKAIVKEK